jgi:DNA-binding IclR family transcriptional regulator
LVILEYLADKPKGCGVTELSERLKYSKNSVFRIAKTLKMYGYLNEVDKAYTVSTKLLALGYTALGEVNIIEKAFDVMRDLRDEAKETVLIGTLVGLHGVVLEQVPSSYEIKFMIDVGHIFLPHTAAPGKAMLAYLPDDERERIVKNMEYKKFNQRTIGNPKAMLSYLEEVRRKGFAVDRAERIEGLHGVACPVFNHWGYPVASIWVTGPSFRMPVSDFARLGELVKKHARRISQRLGWNEEELTEGGNTGKKQDLGKLAGEKKQERSTHEKTDCTNSDAASSRIGVSPDRRKRAREGDLQLPRGAVDVAEVPGPAVR